MGPGGARRARGGGARAIKGVRQAAGATSNRHCLRFGFAVPGTPRPYHPASHGSQGAGRARLGTEPGKFRATRIGRGMRAGSGGVNVERLPSPLLWPIGPCALLEISPVRVLAHHTPHLGVLLKRDTEFPRLARAVPPGLSVLPPPVAATFKARADPAQESDLFKGSYQHRRLRPLGARQGLEY